MHPGLLCASPVPQRCVVDSKFAHGVLKGSAATGQASVPLPQEQASSSAPQTQAMIGATTPIRSRGAIPQLAALAWTAWTQGQRCFATKAFTPLTPQAACKPAAQLYSFHRPMAGYATLPLMLPCSL